MEWLVLAGFVAVTLIAIVIDAHRTLYEPPRVKAWPFRPEFRGFPGHNFEEDR